MQCHLPHTDSKPRHCPPIPSTLTIPHRIVTVLSARLVSTRRDMPPRTGFAPIKYQRNLPSRGPAPLVGLAGVVAVCAWGFWRVGQGSKEGR